MVTGPTTTAADGTYTFTVTAVDASNNVVPGYPGTVHFTSTDAAATLPADAGLTNGTGTFTATFHTPGTQTISVADTANPALAGTSASITVPPTVPPVVPPPPASGEVYAIGTGAGTPARVNVFNADGSLRSAISPFGGAFPGGARVATGDVTGDGVPDTVVGAGPGGAPVIEVYDGATGALVRSFMAFEQSFTGGVYVVAGDMNGDGRADVVATPDEGGGPRVVVFSGKDNSILSNFFGIRDEAFRGGARAAVGDLNHDGVLDLVVAAGFGGGPRVAGYDGRTLGTDLPAELFHDFFVFEETLRNGVFVSAGDMDGDGFADVVFGGGPDGGPRVFVAGGRSLVQNGSAQLTQLANFFGGDPANRGGIRVTNHDLDGDGRSDLIVGAGTGAGSRVTAYLAKDIPTAGTPPEFREVEAFPGFDGGVYVG